MSKINSSNNELIKTENLVDELKNFEKILKNNYLIFNKKLENYENIINTLSLELNNYKEINDETKELLLLELDSNLDKQIQTQTQTQLINNHNYEKINTIIKNKTNNEIYSLNNELKNTKEILNDKNILIHSYENKEKNFLTQIKLLNQKIKEQNNFINEKRREYEHQITIRNSKINYLKNELSEHELLFVQREYELKNQIDNKSNELKTKNFEIMLRQNELKSKEKELNEHKKIIKSLEMKYNTLSSKFEENEYYIDNLKKEILINNLEISYHKKNNITKTIFAPLTILVLFFKSNISELYLNLKLYKIIKDNKHFNIGYYLNNNKDLIESIWCKYFSPELHFVCKGFDEKRTFSKEHLNINSKRDLLKYMMK